MKPECHMITEEYIQRNEGLRLKPYECSAGKLTIGYGRNIEDNGITEEEANIMFEHDLEIVADELREIFQTFDDLSYNRKKCLMDMCFNLGKTRFKRFKKTIRAVNIGDFDEAAAQILDSAYARQLPSRSANNAMLMRKG